MNRSLIFGLFISAIAACAPQTEPTEKPLESKLAELQTVNDAPLQTLDRETELNVQHIVTAYVELVDSDFMELGLELDLFRQEVSRLLSSPSAQNLNAARATWSSAHTVYEQTALHRYFISNSSPEDTALELFQLQYSMNQWPVVAGYIDSVSGYESGGIVHDVNVEISQESLQQQHGLFDVAEATLGFHVIEFLLWGEPFTTSTRSIDDFIQLNQLTSVQIESGMNVSQLGNNRRREILELTVELLIDDFERSIEIWELSKSNFLTTLQDSNSASLLNLVLESATAMLTEELLVRSLYPLLNGDFSVALQSPYSQSTEKSVAAQLRSVEILLLETSTTGGVTLDKILVRLSPVFEEFFYQNLDSAKACLVLLYTTIGAENYDIQNTNSEFEIVECINLLTNLIDQLEQIKLTLPAFLASA